MGFVTDSLFIEKDNKYVLADALVTPVFENESQVKLFKVARKYYLTIITKNNIYFDMVSDLEIKSGTKSMWPKNIKQHQKDKYTAFFVVEVGKNYIATLKDDGITSYVYNKTESTFSKQEIKEIKKIADCFYKTINVPKAKK